MPPAPYFFHFGLGLFSHVENFNAEVSAAVGYRFDEYVGLGLEYRLSATSNVSFARSASLLGLRLRGQHPRGWLAAVGGGMVISAARGDDGFTEYNYRAGGRG